MRLDAAATLARRLMDEHGLIDWDLSFDNAKTRAGVCRPGRREIGLSQPLTKLHTDDEVRDTILHEVAHALVGTQHGHDAVWKRKAVEIGGSGERCVSSRCGELPGAWTGVCPAGHTITRHRRPERVLSCAECCPHFSTRAIFRWTHQGKWAALHPTYLAELSELEGLDYAGEPVPAAGMLVPGPFARPFLPVGTPVVIAGRGPLAGQIGRVFKCGRTRYKVLTGQGIVSVLAMAVRPR